ncbi:MAG: gamma-glutamyl-gamma-aminobutyrate hydrolase family protein [Acidobacteria bacterium]|nr:gamma-glutamyl-gamma-aminobutyrate hydrolase family protein [Acidobacteriota bacterium]
MLPASPSRSQSRPLRIGIPWRTTEEQRQGERKKLDYYFASVRRTGADAIDITLDQSAAALAVQLDDLDGFILPGSPADVDPARYHASRHPKTAPFDANREQTDGLILDHSFKTGKPVLAICFGCQLLNVYQQGTLIQDLQSEHPDLLPHGDTDLPPGAKKGDLEHPATFEPGSRISQLNGRPTGIINSSHHQAIDKPGKDLVVTAYAPDGTIEAVEYQGGPIWVVGVQWHPERMPDDPLAQKLFSEFVAAAERARNARDLVGHKA